MKLIIVTVLVAMIAALSAVAGDIADMTVVSDSQTEWFDSAIWNPSVATWVHPGWTANVNIPGATWIWRSYKVTADEALHGSQVQFQRTFDIPQCASGISGSLSITTDNEYEVFLDSSLVGTDATWQNVNVYDVSSYLVPGSNLLEIFATNAGQNGGVPETNPAGVIYSLEINYDCQEDDIPEFTTIGAGLVLLGAGAIVFKKRK